jgi:hypothetical protein
MSIIYIKIALIFANGVNILIYNPRLKHWFVNWSGI